MEGSWWRVLTKCGPLKKGMANHFSILALEMNRSHSVIFEIVPKYCILDSFVDYDGYTISSKGF